MKKRNYLKYLLIPGVILILLASTGRITTSKQDIDDSLSYTSLELDMSDDTAKEYITYKNNFSYPVELTNNDIYVICTGNGENKEVDEALVEKNLKITAKFKKNAEDKPEDSYVVGKNEEVLIEISSNYEGDKPINEVSCRFGVNIGLS